MLITDLSVIIPIYNTENFLEDCISSVLKLEDISYEIILIDDGSTDNSSKICKSYQKSYPNKIIYHKQKNHGQGYARNIGIKMAQGTYVYFLDSDDYIDSQEILEALRIIKRKNLDLILFEGESFVDRNYSVKSLEKIKRHHKRSDSYSEYIYAGSKALEKLVKNNDFYASPSLYISKKSHLIENGISFLEHCIHEDEFFTPLNIVLSKKIYITHLSVLKRRLRAESTMASVSKDKKKSIDCTIRVILSLFEHKNLLNQSTFRRIIYTLYAQVLVKIFRTKELNRKEYLSYFRDNFNKTRQLKIYQSPKTMYVHITAYYFPWLLLLSIKLIDYLKRVL